MLKSNILIVDDSEISREILITMLEDEYCVYEAKNGIEAVNLLEEKPDFFQLVLLDLNMPEMDGYEVLQIMGEKNWLREVPVIIISAELGEASKLGAVDFLSKPFDREIVRTRIRNVLAIYERYVIDSLTEGLNRKGFIRVAENFLRSGVDPTAYEILFFNVQDFKAVNELIGFENGDVVLKQFYRRLMEAEFSPLAVGRMDCDHFACLAKRQGDSYECLEELCKQKFIQNGKVFRMHIHCGIFHIEDASMPVSGMVDCASLAESYKSDENTKPYTIYTQELKASYLDYAELSGELLRGIEKGEFSVYYQPIMDSETGKVASAEALVRWAHPEKGIVSPGIFIPVLEKDGNISKLDLYVIKQVYEFQKKRKAAGLSIVPISVNLSGIDFYDESMMNQVMEWIRSDEYLEEMLRFEITESSYAVMGSHCLERVKALRRQNIKTLMDDFGTGYSSLSLLHNCEIDILKIDMSFVRQMTDDPKARHILRAIIEMGHQLEMKVVAEGVETEEQFHYLKKYGCDYIQGYFFERPMPETDFTDRLNKNFG